MGSRVQSTVRAKGYLSLAFISLAFWAISIGQLKPEEVAPDSLLGVVPLIPWAFWVGLALLLLASAMAFVDRELRSEGVYLVIALTFSLFIFSLASLAELFIAYYPAGEVKAVLAAGRVDIGSNYPLDAYRAWPAFHFLSVYLLTATGLGLDELVKYGLSLLMVTMPFFLFALGTRLGFSPQRTFSLTMLALASLFIPWFAHNPVTLSFLLYLLLFILLVTYRDTPSHKVMVMLVFFALVTSHGLHSLAALLAALAYFGYSRVRWRQGSKPFAPMLPLIFLVAYVSWYLYVTTEPLFGWGVIRLWEAFTRLDFLRLFGSLAPGGLPPSRHLQVVQLFYFPYIGVYLLALAAMAVLYLLRLRTMADPPRQRLGACLAWIVGLSPLLVVQYGLEMALRLYMLALVPILILVFTLAYRPRVLGIAFLVLAAFLIPARYNGENAGLLTQVTELRGAQFFAQRVNPRERVFYRGPHLMWYYQPALVATYLSVPIRTFYHTVDTEVLEYQTYIIDSRQNHDYLMFRFSYDPVREWLNSHWGEVTKLYSNGNFDTYQRVD